ncbi:MAG: AI-2E family transporter [Deltaproteobacteria bacterium]|nr:AI-2E family transporter [Deltaproteobacteria bacterium]MBW1930226.1 AI-2E family transporter [Deltaproteobacteria bacterium]MBW2024289.1 AI-2E family transporter [Deltaproteobacteria bacterium]RLB22978.1 MAG: AI-2E family transporter [Deltaproteobacteria bacterium]
MNNHSNSKLFLIFLGCSTLLLLWLFWSYFSAVLLGLLIGSVFYPLYSLLLKLLRYKETAAALVMTLFILVILVLPVGWFGGTLSNEAFDFYNKTRSAVSLNKIQSLVQSDSLWGARFRNLAQGLGVELTPENVEKLTTAIGKRVGFFLYKQIRSAVSNLLSFLIHFFLMMLTIFYVFRDGTKLKEYLVQLIPIPREQLEKLAYKFNEMGKAIVVGNGLSGAVQGILGGLGFYLFGLHSPFLWGTIIAFMAFLPIVGASVVFLPATAILLIQGKFGTAMGFLVYNLCYSAFVEYVAKPKLIGKGMKMNSFLVFIGIIGGIKLFGILGIVYGPLIITIFLTLAEIYRLEYKTVEAV